MEAKFTPGPWKAEGGWIRADAKYGNGGEACIVGSIEYGPDAPDQSTAYANAALIAAAPELLEALKVCEQRMTFEMSEAEQMEHDLDGHEPEFCTLCQARAAIAKAEGRG